MVQEFSPTPDPQISASPGAAVPQEDGLPGAETGPSTFMATAPEVPETATTSDQTLAPEAAAGSDLVALRQRLEQTATELKELRDWRAQQETERQRTQSAAAEQAQLQRIRQDQQEIAAELMTDYGVPAEKATPMAQQLAISRYLATPEGQQQLYSAYLQSPQFQQTDWFQKGRAHAVYELANQLIEDSIAPLVPSNYTPRQTMAYLKEQRKQLIDRSKGDPALMEELVKVWGDGLRNHNREERAGSPAERVDVGSATSGLGALMSPRERYLADLRAGKPIPTAAEIDRLTAQYLR